MVVDHLLHALALNHHSCIVFLALLLGAHHRAHNHRLLNLRGLRTLSLPVHGARAVHRRVRIAHVVGRYRLAQDLLHRLQVREQLLICVDHHGLHLLLGHLL